MLRRLINWHRAHQWNGKWILDGKLEQFLIQFYSAAILTFKQADSIDYIRSDECHQSDAGDKTIKFRRAKKKEAINRVLIDRSISQIIFQIPNKVTNYLRRKIVHTQLLI